MSLWRYTAIETFNYRYKALEHYQSCEESIQLLSRSADKGTLSMENVWVFFYGTFMSAKILREYGINCEATIPAKLNGYELSIRPRVNLKKNESCVSYGGLAHISHQDISRLYSDLNDKFGITYYPYPVIAELADGSLKPALCYISFDIRDSLADPDYVNKLARCATGLEAPEAYIGHIKSFMQLAEQGAAADGDKLRR